MKIKYLRKIILVVLLLNSFHCNSTETNESEIDNTLKIKDILPYNPNIGDKLKIILNRKLNSGENFKFIFFDNNWSYSDSIINDTLYSFLPYIKNNTSVEVKLLITKGDQSYEVTKSIGINNNCLNGICVIKNNEGKISEKDIYPRDLLGNVPEWKINNAVDTIIISSLRTTADEANEKLTLNFVYSNSNILPSFINFTLINNESDGAGPYVTTYDTLKNGLIKIEDWNNNGIYSGIIYAELEPLESRTYFPPRTVFWSNK